VALTTALNNAIINCQHNYALKSKTTKKTENCVCVCVCVSAYVCIGPVFIEFPIDVLYPYKLVVHEAGLTSGKTLLQRLINMYVISTDM